MHRAETAELPAEAERLGYGDDEPTRRLLLLCCELGRDSGGKFFLSGNKAASVVGDMSSAWAYKLLGMFAADGFLKKMKAGNEYTATRWLWTHEAEDATETAG